MIRVYIQFKRSHMILININQSRQKKMLNGYLKQNRCETYVIEFIDQSLMQKTASKSMQK